VGCKLTTLSQVRFDVRSNLLDGDQVAEQVCVAEGVAAAPENRVGLVSVADERAAELRES